MKNIYSLQRIIFFLLRLCTYVNIVVAVHCERVFSDLGRLFLFAAHNAL